MSFGSNAAFIARGLLHQLDCRKLREEMAQGTAVPRKSVGRIACPIMESIDLDRDPSATDDREDRDSKIPIPDRSRFIGALPAVRWETDPPSSCDSSRSCGSDLRNQFQKSIEKQSALALSEPFIKDGRVLRILDILRIAHARSLNGSFAQKHFQL